MKFSLISSKYFAMVEFLTHINSASILVKLKKQAFRDVFLYQFFLKCSQSLENTCERIQYLLLKGNNKTYWSPLRLSFQEICSNL